MKKVTLMFAGAVVAAGLLAGCGSSVDENKTPEQIRQEIASWDSAKIQKAVDEYTKAIAAKTEELNAALAKVKDLLAAGTARRQGPPAEGRGRQDRRIVEEAEGQHGGLRRRPEGEGGEVIRTGTAG